MANIVKKNCQIALGVNNGEVIKAIISQKCDDIDLLPKDDNPPNAPAVRPIEKFWAILKARVYAGNFIAESKAELIDRIREVVAALPQSLFTNLFKNLKKKIRKASREGLDSLI